MPDTQTPEITSFEATADDAPAPRASACRYCGSPLDALDRFCPVCGGGQAADTEIGEVEAIAPAAEERRFQCKNCGAEVAIDPDQRSYTCAFCDSTYVVELPQESNRRQPPEFVIPFGVTLDEAHGKFQQWIKAGGLFRPGDLQNVKIAKKLRGVYLPFWAFSMLAQSRWSASIGEHWYRTETYTTRQNGKTVTKTRTVTETEWWPLDGRHHRYYSGFLVSGSRGLNQRDAERIKPFRLEALRRYRPDFLAGWLSEKYSLQSDEALTVCKREFRRREESNIAANMPGDTHRGLAVETQFSRVNSDLILLPIFLLSYRHKGKLFRFMVNGQTGRVAGDRPLSGWKIGVAVVAGLLLLLVLFLLATVLM